MHIFRIDKEKNIGAYKDSGVEVNGELSDSLYLQLQDFVNSLKSEEEIEKEKLDKALEKLDEKLTDEEKLENADLYTKMADGLEVVKGKTYNYAGELYEALDSFIYDNQQNPHLEPEKWRKIEPKKSQYDTLYENAKPWSRDLSYEAGSYVTRYSELYTNDKKITDNEEPGKGLKWRKIEI